MRELLGNVIITPSVLNHTLDRSCLHKRILKELQGTTADGLVATGAHCQVWRGLFLGWASHLLPRLLSLTDRPGMVAHLQPKRLSNVLEQRDSAMWTKGVPMRPWSGILAKSILLVSWMLLRMGILLYIYIHICL